MMIYKASFNVPYYFEIIQDVLFHFSNISVTLVRADTKCSILVLKERVLQ